MQILIKTKEKQEKTYNQEDLACILRQKIYSEWSVCPCSETVFVQTPDDEICFIILPDEMDGLDKGIAVIMFTTALYVFPSLLEACEFFIDEADATRESDFKILTKGIRMTIEEY